MRQYADFITFMSYALLAEYYLLYLAFFLGGGAVGWWACKRWHRTPNRKEGK